MTIKKTKNKSLTGAGENLHLSWIFLENVSNIMTHASATILSFDNMVLNRFFKFLFKTIFYTNLQFSLVSKHTILEITCHSFSLYFSG